MMYVGQHKGTNPDRRFREHKQLARTGSPTRFHKAIREFGESNFTIEVIDKAETFEELQEKERYWIAQYNSTDPNIGYNVCIGGATIGDWYENHSQRMSGSGNPSYGKPFPAPPLSGTLAALEWMKEHPEEHKQSCVKASKKSWEGLTEEQREARMAPMRNARWAPGVSREVPESRKEKLRHSMSGESNPFFGRKHSEASKEKCRATRRARKEARLDGII